jgi:hypothetical protein
MLRVLSLDMLAGSSWTSQPRRRGSAWWVVACMRCARGSVIVISYVCQHSVRPPPIPRPPHTPFSPAHTRNCI